MSEPALVSAVPRRMRLVCALIAVVVVAVSVFVASTLPYQTRSVVEFRTVDQIAVVGLGLFIGGAVLLLGRSRVDADADGIRFRNILLSQELSWEAVRAVAFDRKASWASLRLRNDDEVSLLAIQAVDGEHAVRAVEGLRALLAAAEARRPAPPPLLYDN